MMEKLTILSNPEDTWDAYCAETPAEGRSPQGAMAFAIDRLHEVLPEIEKLRLHIAQLEEANQVYAEDANRDARVNDELRSQLVRAKEAIGVIVKVNADFRVGMPKEWEGDPLQDAIDAANFNILINAV